MSLKKSKEYYDSFSKTYDRRIGNAYHDMLDDIEVDLIREYGEGKSVLECGCGTGLILERVNDFASSVKGIDLSTGMVEKTSSRGFHVTEGSVTNIPFPDNSFDLAYSVKVLAHVEDIETALKEMQRVVVPGGYVIAEFYNSKSIRELVRKLRPGFATGEGCTDKDVYYRADTPDQVQSYFPTSMRIVEERGIRVITVFPGLIGVPLIGSIIKKVEKLLSKMIPRAGGFYCVVAQKN